MTSTLSKNPILHRIGVASITMLLAASHLATAFAQESKSDIQASTQIHKISMVNEKEVYIATPTVGLDDVIQYTMDYHNSTEKGLSNVQVTFKIPRDMRYVARSITPEPSHAKVINSNEWQKYPILEFVDGRPQEVSASIYDAFAWTIPRIESRKTERIILRAKLIQRPSIK